MNVVLLVCDTLRYDHLGCHGNKWIRTPNLDRLARESFVFHRAFAASYPTIPHRTDLITGRWGGPFHAWKPLPHATPTLPRLLADAGWATQLIHDTPHLVNGGHNFDWPFHAWTMVRGAEVDRDWIGDRSMRPANWAADPLFDFIAPDAFEKSIYATYGWSNRHRRRPEEWNAARLFRTAGEWLADNRARDRFFLWLDCFDPHEPWDAPPEFARLYDPTPGWDGRVDPRSFLVRDRMQAPEAASRRVRALYAAKVSWVDHNVGELLDALDRTGLARRTALVVTSDHGTNLGEERWGKAYPVGENEGHVPLLIRVPGGEPGEGHDLVQAQDVSATILSLAGVAPPPGAEGRNLLAPPATAGARREVALSGCASDGWVRKGHSHLFTVFGRDHWLEVGTTPDKSRLHPAGSYEDVSAAHPGVVADLHRAALDEVIRRGTDPAIAAWLRGGGQGEFPKGCRFWDGWPGPAGYSHYFGKLFKEA